MIVDIWENVRVAFGGLTSNKMRSGLTMLGIVIGVAAVIALMSVGEGAQASITNEINAAGSNLVYVIGDEDAALTMRDVKAIADPRNVPSAARVAPVFNRSTQVVFGDQDVTVSVSGVTPEYAEIMDNVEPARGRFIEKKDLDGRGAVAVLGYQTAQDLFGGFDPIGQKIKVSIPGQAGGRVLLTVVGVLAEQDTSGMSNPNEIVLVPLTTAQTRIFNGRNALGEMTIGYVVLEAGSEKQVDLVSSEVSELLRERHNLKSDEEDDFEVIAQADLLSMVTQVTDVMTVFLGAIAGISLLVGGIGIMNIMLVSVTERTREIGLRKAVGARRADVLAQFLIEAIVLSVIGGVLGILLGTGLGALVNLSGLVTSRVTFQSVALAVGFSIAIGVFFGIYPANQAARLNPIEALRYE